MSCDVAIVGSGMAGSLLALVLERLGRRVVVIDRGHHPRFAIGESSTPTADLILRDLCRRYELPRLLPLTRYGTWRASYPELLCGKKRGFSYFGHRPHERFRPADGHGNELMVAASADDARSDTHWLRADVDGFLANEVRRAGIPLYEGTEIHELERSTRWRLQGDGDAGPIRLEAELVVDATGAGGFLAAALGIADEAEHLRTRSRALYSHFLGVRPFAELLESQGSELSAHPFACDAAAQHHLLEGAWMWNLRFESGLVSAGFALDLDRHPAPAALSAADEWRTWVDRYPSLAEQFAAAEVVDPPGQIVGTGRLQRLAARAAGLGWAMLPHAAGFIDPLHSSGIAHSLCGVERLAGIVERHWGRPELEGSLTAYSRILRQELLFLDLLVHSCYLTMTRFRLFVLATMLYFAAATTWEHRRAESDDFAGALLCADDAELVRRATETHRRFQALLRAEPGDPTLDDRIAGLERELARVLAPWNRVGLLEPAARNMYAYTAVDL